MPSLLHRSAVLLGASIALGSPSSTTVAAPLHPSEIPSGRQIVGYVSPKRVLTAADIPADKLTRINYAFSAIKDGEMVEGSSFDSDNFALLVSLKQQNPTLTILISVGGWGGSGGFSDMALTAASRARFIDSVVRFVTRYKLDGLDIDWEYPGLVGAGNTFRPEDKQNYTALLRELRSRFDREQKQQHRRLFTSIAVGGNADFIEHTEMAAVARFVDTVNLMTYDYYGPDSDQISGNHAPLFTDPADPKQISTDRTVREYEAAGVPASKLLLGLPFYGKSWADVGSDNNGLFQPGAKPSGTFHDYSALANYRDQGYKRYWDAAAAVPWLYNPDTRTFISYEDSESLTRKCRFALNRHLGGVMFWELTEDDNGTLLNTINASLRHAPPTLSSGSSNAVSR